MIFHKRYSKFHISFALIGALALFGTACDSGVDDMNDTESTSVSGQVTEEESSNGSSGGLLGRSSSDDDIDKAGYAGVEGAVVTAVALHADGSVSPLDGEATTNANGEYTIQVEGEGASDHIRLIANGEGGFESSVIVQVDGRSSVDARPMTFESHARSEIYIRAKANDESDSHAEGVTTADVAFFADTGVTSEINAGAQSAAQIGMAIANAVNAQAAYNSRTDAGINMSAIAEAKFQAFTRLQSDIAAAADAEARAAAYANFEETYLSVYSESGVDAETKAEILQTSATLLVNASNRISGEAQLGLRKKAELVRAKATALALEAKFEAESASQATIEALAEARVKLIAEIRAAVTVEDILEAKAEFKSAVDTHIEAAFEISSEIRAEAESNAEESREVLLDIIANLSILAESAAEATADAFAEFYAEAQADASASLQSSGIANAEAVAGVIVTLSIMNN